MNKFVDHSHGQENLRPPDKTRLKAFSDFIYNSSEGSCLGRTPASWAKIILFYIIFYACLAAFCAVCFWGLMQTIDPDTPTYILDRSLIGTSPGLASRPMPPEGRDSFLIYKRDTKSWTNAEWLSALDEFLNDYQEASTNNTQKCNYTKEKENSNMVCEVDPADWKVCQPDGTKVDSICIFFKINKMFGWMPNYYKAADSLPGEMPDDLKQAIQQEEAERLNKVWLSCVGKHETDIANLGNVSYYPERGFPGYYYPFHNQQGFRSPVVAVHLKEIQPDVEINLECRSWAHNIEHDRRYQLGVLNFKIKIE